MHNSNSAAAQGVILVFCTVALFIGGLVSSAGGVSSTAVFAWILSLCCAVLSLLVFTKKLKF